MKGYTAWFTMITPQWSSLHWDSVEEGWKLAPAVDYYDNYVPAYVVCAGRIVQWHNQLLSPKQCSLKSQLRRNVGAPQAAKPVDQAILDAVKELNVVSSPGLRPEGKENC
eukprot:2355969-Rhodomonas_salina.1